MHFPSVQNIGQGLGFAQVLLSVDQSRLSNFNNITIRKPAWVRFCYENELSCYRDGTKPVMDLEMFDVSSHISWSKQFVYEKNK